MVLGKQDKREELLELVNTISDNISLAEEVVMLVKNKTYRDSCYKSDVRNEIVEKLLKD